MTQQAQPSSAARLEAIIGPGALRKLMRALGGRMIRVPNPKVSTAKRRAIIDALDCRCGDEMHHSYSAVARRYRLPRSTVYRIANARQ